MAAGVMKPPATNRQLRRRSFLKWLGIAAPACFAAPSRCGARHENPGPAPARGFLGAEMAGDLVIVGGGLGGCAAALAAARNGLRVILTEETDWIGAQLTAQAVPPDENRWIETIGGTRSYL